LIRRLLALSSIAVAIAATAHAQTKPAVPLDPIETIIDAFRTHDIVALGEGRHNNDQGYAFRLALIRDPRFAAAVNDIVVESGSAAHQDVMDRYIRGEPVANNELRLAWQDTTVADGPWDVPMYEEFFTAIRTLNASLPAERKLRVLLGDISSRRDAFPVELIQREVLAKQRRALVIYGDMHFARRPLGSNIVTRLVDMKARVLNIWTHASTADPGYMKMSLSRMALMEPSGATPPPGTVSPSERLRRYCESVATR